MGYHEVLWTLLKSGPLSTLARVFVTLDEAFTGTDEHLAAGQSAFLAIRASEHDDRATRQPHEHAGWH
jgi:hypothetical protein